jgi:hypothetical protein
MVNVDAAQVRPGEIADELFEAWWTPATSGWYGWRGQVKIAFPATRQDEIGYLCRPEMDADQRPRRPIWFKLSEGPGIGAAGLAVSVSGARSVRTRRQTERRLAADGAGAAAQGGSDGPQAHALQPHGRQRLALFSLHLLESSGHLHTLPDESGVALET